MEIFEDINKELGTNYKSNFDIDWRFVRVDCKLSEKFIEKYFDKLSPNIECFQKLSEGFIEKHISNLKLSNIFHYQKLSESFIEKYADGFSLRFIIPIYQKISEAFIEKHKDEIDWFYCSIYQTLSEPFIEKHKDKVDWSNICQFQELSEEFIERNINILNKPFLCSTIIKYQNLSLAFIEKYLTLMPDFKDVSSYQPLTEEVIEKYKDFIDWSCITKYQKLSENFIEKHKDKLSKGHIFECQKLSENFIERFPNKNAVDWFNIAKFQKLSERFIKKHIKELPSEEVAKYQYLSDDLKLNKDFKYFFNKYNNYDLWQYLDVETKKQELIKTGKYECHDDYFIAYKSIRKDRYSHFNFQYQYLPGETYESTCDCTDNENSFGLNVGTYEFAKSFGETKHISTIVKCKIYYKDIGRIVHNGNKVRCFKITVLE